MKKIVIFVFFINCFAFGQTKESNFLLFANVGQSYRLDSSPDDLTPEKKEYYKKLKSGLSYDISAYYTNYMTGFGLKYNVYKSTGTIDDQQITRDNIKISFIGPSFIINEDKNGGVGEANIELALGYIWYQNKSVIMGRPLKITGANLGMVGGLGYQFRITRYFLLGPKVSFTGGVLKKLKYEHEDGQTETIKLDKKEFENLWRIDLAIEAKFRF